MKTIINVLLILILLTCLWQGYKKGLIMGIGGVIVIIVSLYAANLMANAYSGEIISALEPFASGFTEGKLTAEDGIMDRMGWGDSSYSADDMLKAYPERGVEFATNCFEVLGIDSATSLKLGKSAVLRMNSDGGSLTENVVTILCETVSYVGCYSIAFILVIIVLTVIGNIPNFSYKLPNLDAVNDIGGVVMGAITGVCFCVIICWVLKFLGLIIGEGTLAHCGFATIFTKIHLLDGLFGL